MMESKNVIMAAIDFSPCSAAALREARRLAAWLGAGVTAMHVVTPIPPLAPDPIGLGGIPIPHPTEEQLTAGAHRRWAAFAEMCGGSAGIRFVVEPGSPRDQILEAVRRDRPRMLLVGAFGTADASRGIGTTAAACAQRAATQVMVVREGSAGPFRSVVACVDFSDTSRTALEEAIAIASGDGAALHILHVYSDPWQGLGPPRELGRNMPDFAEAYRSAVERRVKDFCEPLSHELGALKPTIHGLQAPGHADGIMSFINAHGCGLAVLGTRGKFNLRDFFWGSTAERVVREARCSVLAVKPRGFVEPASGRSLADSTAATRIATRL